VTGGAPALGEVGAMVRVGGHRERSAQPGCATTKTRICLKTTYIRYSLGIK
jgi:hypothetical protein